MEKAKKDSARPTRRGLFVVIGLLILVVALVGAFVLVKTKPKAKKKKRASMVPIVELVMIKASDENVIVNGMGTVIPAVDINLQSEVNGRVTWINPDFIEGGFVKKDDVVIKIDDSDYKLAILRRQAQLKIEESNLRLEDGRQDIAKREWEMLNVKADFGGADLELALRKPQRIKQQALVDAARSDLGQAELMLARTEIKAPFDAVVRRASVNIGDQASLGKVLAQLVGVDTYWVLASVRVSELKWISLPDSEGKNGAVVEVILADNRSRAGVVIRQLPDLEANGRMARLLIAVDNPVGDGSDKEQVSMLLGQYVRVRIMGPAQKNVYRVSRNALRDGSELWLLGKGNKLDIVDVDVVWSDRDSVVLNGNALSDGDKLIMSDLDVVVEGMQLRDVKGLKDAGKGKGSGKGPGAGQTKGNISK